MGYASREEHVTFKASSEAQPSRHQDHEIEDTLSTFISMLLTPQIRVRWNEGWNEDLVRSGIRAARFPDP